MARRTRFHTRRRFLTTGANLGFLVLTCTCVPLVVVSPWLALGVFVGVFVVWGVILAKVPPRGGRRFYEITDEALIVETTDSRTVVPWQDIEHLLHRPTAMTREGLDDVTHWEVLTLYLADGDRIDIHGVHGQYRLSKQIVARCRDRIVQRLRTAFERDGEVTYGALHLSPVRGAHPGRLPALERRLALHPRPHPGRQHDADRRSGQAGRQSVGSGVDERPRTRDDPEGGAALTTARAEPVACGPCPCS